MKDLTLIGSSLKSRWLNALLSVFLTAFGVMLALLIIQFGHHIQDRLSADGQGIDIVVGAKGSPLQLILSSVYHIDIPTGNIPYEQAEKWMKHPQIKTAVPLALGDNWKGYRIVGTSAAYMKHYGAELSGGRIWGEAFEAVAGAYVGLKIGDAFTGAHGLMEGGHEHADEHYKITGVMKPTGTVLDRLILTSLDSVLDIHGLESVEHHDHEGAHHEDHDAHEEHEHEAHDEHGHEAHDEHGHEAHDEHGHEAHDEHGHEGHDHTGTDPHVWLDPANAKVLAHNVMEQLSKLDPEHKQEFAANYQAFVRALETADNNVKATLAPIKDVPYFVFHEAYGYFEGHYGLNNKGAVTLSPERKPGAKTVANIRTEIEEHNVACIFSEPQFSPAIVETLIDGTDVKTAVLDPLGVSLKLSNDSYPAFLEALAGQYATCLK